eukprot:TRINITY_DN1004_c0_g2_i4.p1 TRINITY_DN1004_c0_g2~~TRINITY_DN1004_c0_g2_i4.p1  ORF type:complete len:766 (+),score=272.00 TRINITY_DN1004_c0_g2_i4:89-2299(+)
MWKPGVVGASNKEKETKNQQARQLVKDARSLLKQAGQTTNPEKLHEIRKQAMDKYNRAIIMRPACALGFFYRGHCWRQLGDHKRALFDYTMAIQIDDTKTDYYGNRGMCFRYMGKLEDSVNDFMRAIALDSSDGSWYYQLGLTYYDMCDKQGAIEMYSRALDKEKEKEKDGSEKKKTKAKSLYHRGNTYRELGHLDESIADLKLAVELDEKNAMAHNNLGLSYFEKGSKEDYKLAEQHFWKAIENDPEKAIFYNNRGLAHFQLGDYQEALQDFDKAVTKEQDNANIYFNRGNAQLCLGLYDRAISDFDDAIRRVPDDENNYHSKGIVFQVQGNAATNIQAAIEQFKKALDVNPDFIPSLFHLGLMYHISPQSSQLFLAMECFTKVLKAAPDDRRAYESLGLVYCDLLYYDLAVGAFTKAIELKEDYAVNYFYRGKSFLWLGRHEDAISDFNQAFALGCEDPQVYNCRAMAHKYLKRYGAAISDLKEAIEKAPENVEYLYNRAQCNMDVGRYEDATQDLSAAIKIEQNEAKLFYLRGKSYYQQARGKGRQEALAFYEHTIKDMSESLCLDANSQDAHDCWYHQGIAHANSGNHALAISAFNNAIKLKPNTAAYVHERAKSLQNEGHYADAITDFTKVIQLQPYNAHAYFRRAFAFKSLGTMAAMKSNSDPKSASDLSAFDESAADFERARQLQPENPHLVVNYKKIFDVEFIELCAAGDEPDPPVSDGADEPRRRPA